MTEQEAIDEIKDKCHDEDDPERNAFELDKIIERFLNEKGFSALVAAIDDVDCW